MTAIRLAMGIVLAALGAAGSGRADCLLDQAPNTVSDNLTVLFPNWSKVPVASFNVTVCTDGVCPGTPACNIVGLTIYNYGTADGSNDLGAVTWNMTCGKTVIWETMTYAGVWVVGGNPRPAWTWAGNMAWGSDPQFACASTPAFSVFADVRPCPTDGAEVTMGLGFNDVVNPAQPGGMWDACGCQVPNYDQVRTGRTKYIRYLYKTSAQDVVAPGDTVFYTLYYGRPGAALTGIEVLDTLPPDTHYVFGSSVPAADAGWDPDVGPPARLRWSLPGGATAGGPTGEIRFAVSVDWGNGDAFEPGSGDLGAREGLRLENTASASFPGSGCSPGTYGSLPTGAIVRRYLMWKVADQDLLYAPKLGQPDDEITYSIYLRNTSASKTWWNVSIWDTVPPQLEVWGGGAGFWDVCAGAWTMTPAGGCSPGAPGRLVDPVRTLLTWTLDLPPGATLEIQWKARVRVAGVQPGMTALSRVSVMALGSAGQVGGSGHARVPRTFLHLARIVLRTSYFSYVGQSDASTSCGDLPAGGLKINLYPLNRSTNFELRKLFYEGAGTFAATGGVSASIGSFQGTCSGGYLDGGYGGCGAERSPTQYFLPPPCPATPNAILFKLTANAPVLWLMMPEIGAGGDAFTFTPSTSLNHSGFTHYSYRRCVLDGKTGVCSTSPGYGETWTVFNTSRDPDGTFVPGRTTTVHIFRWDFGTLTWQYDIGGDIDAESLWMPYPGCPGGSEGHYRLISSDASVLIYQGYGTIGDPSGIPYAYNEHGNLVPTAENGLKTSTPGAPGTFYTLAYHDAASNINMMIGNADPVLPSTYRIYQYRSRTPGLAVPGIPPSLAGNSGVWDLKGIRTTDAGFPGPINPRTFGTGPYDKLTNGTGGTANAWKIEWQSGGPIMVNAGANMMRDWAGGSVIHTSDAKSAGKDFWFHQYNNPGSWSLLAFAHSAGMAVRATSNQGFSATYTTTGPDQCVGYMNLASIKADAIVYRVELLPGGVQGDLVVMYHQTEFREKFFTAPFVATGVHYDIITPPIAFVGQPFWLTVIVVVNDGNTKLDYCGTTSFTSTDPTAKIEGTDMDSYSFAWDSSNAVCPPCVGTCDDGVRIFVNVVMQRLGLQTLVATDTLDGSITGVAGIMVVGAEVKFEKSPRVTNAASGDTVQFRICWSNYSSSSAFTFVITDAVPMGTTYLPEAGTWAMNCGSTDGIGMGISYSTATTPTVPAPASWVTANPVAATRWLRWTIPWVGVQTTGCACFRVSVQ